MNYIVFDLEWNQSPGGKRWSNSRLPFEIIEIGAIKLNEFNAVCECIIIIIINLAVWQLVYGFIYGKW